MKSELTDRQRLFCEYYAADPNATMAARRAGYAPKAAAQQGARLLTFAKIRKEIQRLQREAAGARIADAREVQEQWTTVLRDQEAPTSARLKAGELLVRSGAGFQVDQDSGDDLDPPVGGTIRLPYVRQMEVVPFNAVEMEDGEIVPLSGHEDEQVWRFVSPYRMDELAQQMATDEAIYQWDEPD